jgi:hypothetical protein
MSILVAIFLKDIERATVKVMGVPASGAEDMPLSTLREKNPNVANALLAGSIFNPMAISEYHAARVRACPPCDTL